MRWFFNNKSARRVMMAFSGVFILNLLIGIIGIFGLNHIRLQFRSIYQQRLIPASEIAQVIELQYQNRFHLEEVVSGITVETKPQLVREIDVNNKMIDSIINEYVTLSYRGKQEDSDYRNYQGHVKAYRDIEKEIINAIKTDSTAKATWLFRNESYQTFASIIKPLERLETDQITNGRELFNSGYKESSTIRMLLLVVLSISIGVAVILGIIVSREYVQH